MDLNEHLSSGSSGFSLSKYKKKKCRGNRKLQRLRRQCYKKGMSTQDIEKLILMKKTERSMQDHSQVLCDKNTNGSNLINTTSSIVNMQTLSENQV